MARRAVVRFGVRMALAAMILLAGAWMLRSKPQSTWLYVEAERYPVAGQDVHVRVDVMAPNRSPEWLVADLHWKNLHREPRGYLAGSPAQALSREGDSFDFRIPLPRESELGYVFAVIYESPSGRWQDHTRVATTDPVAVLTSPPREGGETRVRWVAHDPVHDEAPSIPSRGGAWSAALAWLGAAFMLLRRHFIERRSTAISRGDDRGVMTIAYACIAAALWELTTLGTTVPNLGRSLALGAHLYYEREWAQIAATLVVLLAASLVLARIVDARREAGDKLVRVALMLFLGATAAALISHHAIDRLAGAVLWTLPAIGWLKIGCGVLAVAGSSLILLHDRRGLASSAC